MTGYRADVPTPPAPRADRLARVGGILFVVGVLSCVAAVVPLFIGSARLPVAFYVGAGLAPIGLGLVLISFWRTARARSRATRTR